MTNTNTNTDADPPSAPPSHSLADLCVLVDLPPRTVRYYIQIGLVDKPDGETRAARYGTTQLEQLLLIKKWTAAGLSLERIRALLRGDAPPATPRLASIGSVEVCSHVHVADGVEVVIAPSRARLSPEQTRQFIRGVMAAFADLQHSHDATASASASPADADPLSPAPPQS